MAIKLPKVKKRINAFLLGEEGKITKESMLKIGAFVSGVAIASSLMAKSASAYYKHSHGPSPALVHDADKTTLTHNHHSSHYSHSSCCVAKGSTVTTHFNRRTLERIENLKVGQSVWSYNLKESKGSLNKINGLETPIRDRIYIINNSLKITEEHPIWCRKKDGKICWAAIDPIQAKKEVPSILVNKLERGDELFHIDDGWTEITSIDVKDGKIQTYNLSNIENNNNYFVEGFLVHNKGGW